MQLMIAQSQQINNFLVLIVGSKVKIAEEADEMRGRH